MHERPILTISIFSVLGAAAIFVYFASTVSGVNIFGVVRSEKTDSAPEEDLVAVDEYVVENSRSNSPVLPSATREPQPIEPAQKSQSPVSSIHETASNGSRDDSNSVQTEPALAPVSQPTTPTVEPDTAAVPVAVSTPTPDPAPQPALRSCQYKSFVLQSGESIRQFSKNTVEAPASCRSQNRTCTDGTLSGSFSFDTCEVQNPTVKPEPPAPLADCTFSGSTIVSGNSVTAYAAAKVTAPATCQSQTRTCSDGTLSGDFSEASCVVEQPAPVLSWEERLAAGGEVAFPAGTFEFTGGVEILNSARITGAGKNNTKLVFTIDRTQPAVRILASDVSISGLEIEVRLTQRLADGVVSGGRGDRGTGITIGRFVNDFAHEVVRGVRVQDVKITRAAGTPAAAGMTIIGRAQNVSITDVDFGGYHSTGIIMHWGGYSTVPESMPYATRNPQYDLIETYHPHAVTVRNIDFNQVARAFILSSIYDVNISKVRGQISALLTMLPGDEVNDFSIASDRGNVGEDISLTDVDVRVYAKTGVNNAIANQSFIAVSSQGTSKVQVNNRFDTKRIHPYRNLSFSDITVRDFKNTQRDFKYGIDLFKLTGSNIVFRDIDLANIASTDYFGPKSSSPAAFGVRAVDSDNLVFDGISTRATHGFSFKNSRNIQLKNSQAIFDSGNAEHTTNGGRNTYGLHFSTYPLGIATGDISVQNLTLQGHRYGIRYPKDLDVSSCESFSAGLSNIALSDQITPELRQACEVAS